LEFLPGAKISDTYIQEQEEKEKEREDKKNEALERQQQRETGTESGDGAEPGKSEPKDAVTEPEPENGAEPD
jgi:hypothetical protein